jgi:hypothetical protein
MPLRCKTALQVGPDGVHTLAEGLTAPQRVGEPPRSS